MAAAILVVEDEDILHRLFIYNLKKWEYEAVAVKTGAEFREQYKRRTFDAVLLDLKLPDADGMDLLVEIKKHNPDIPAVIMTAYGTVELAVEAMKYGAYDFITKPFDWAKLQVTVKNAVERHRLTQRLTHLEQTLGRRKRFQSIVGVNEKMQTLYSIIENVAPSNISVMITGESGTGKELVAQAIHRLSGRRDREIVDVNCAAIPAELMESELFGHERGSFTGASQRHIGSCERADKSTLFLDEICEMDISLQAKLLRFLQERYFQRVGGKERVYVDTRIVSATNKDPLEVVRQGRFREDLFYRLNVVTIEVPPLRERRDDIPLLAQHFLETVSRENDKPFREISKEAAYLLSCHDWPGNVRELQNAIVQAVALHSGTTLTVEMLPPALRREIRIPPDFTISTLAGPDIRTEPFPDKSASPSDSGETQIIPLAETEKKEIERALRICSGNIREVCKRLGISQATLYRKIQEYGLRTGQFKKKVKGDKS